MEKYKIGDMSFVVGADCVFRLGLIMMYYRIQAIHDKETGLLTQKQEQTSLIKELRAGRKGATERFPGMYVDPGSARHVPSDV